MTVLIEKSTFTAIAIDDEASSLLRVGQPVLIFGRLVQDGGDYVQVAIDDPDKRRTQTFWVARAVIGVLRDAVG